jgi:hypothetical protein
LSKVDFPELGTPNILTNPDLFLSLFSKIKFNHHNL